jgi:hypothetical protein
MAFPVLIAHGINEPASTTDASNASSIPYACLFWMR